MSLHSVLTLIWLEFFSTSGVEDITLLNLRLPIRMLNCSKTLQGYRDSPHSTNSRFRC